jgi:hypothetical protein
LKILKVKIRESPYGWSRVVVYGKAGRQTNWEAKISFLQLFYEEASKQSFEGNYIL